jgi:hypothetical protein
LFTGAWLSEKDQEKPDGYPMRPKCSFNIKKYIGKGVMIVMDKQAATESRRADFRALIDEMDGMYDAEYLWLIEAFRGECENE